MERPLSVGTAAADGTKPLSVAVFIIHTQIIGLLITQRGDVFENV
jgi:hypothetical protein